MSGLLLRAKPAGALKRDIWRMVDGSWGAETERNGVGVGVRFVSLPRAIWHVLTVRRPDEYAPRADAVAVTLGDAVLTPNREGDHA